MHYVYIIYSTSINKFYVGETSNPFDQIQQHNTGYFKGSYTSKANDWKTQLILEFDSIEQARKAEAIVKRMNSRKFIENLIIDSEWLVEKFKI